MPIIIPEFARSSFYDCLQPGTIAISQERADHQDIRPARIGILNLMPAAVMNQTVGQWLYHMSRASILQIEPVPMKFDNDARAKHGSSRSEILALYKPFSEVAEYHLDGLIITGDNLELARKSGDKPRELLSFDEIRYATQLRQVIDWARAEVPITVYSCLASHFALHYLFGMERELAPQKISGVYQHNINDSVQSDFTTGLDATFRAPHSRWGNVPVQSLEQEPTVDVLASNHHVGWLLAQMPNQSKGYDLLIQGHPEYGKLDLDIEYRRDSKKGMVQQPEGYYAEQQGKRQPQLTWANDAKALHSNLIASIYSRFS